MTRSFTFEVFDISRLFQFSRRHERFVFVAATPLLYVIVVLVALIDGDLSQSAPFSYTADFRQLLGVSDNDTSLPVISLQRDVITLSLILVIGLTYICTYCQFRAVNACMPLLEKTGVLHWHPRPQADRIPAPLRRYLIKDLSPAPGTARHQFQFWADARVNRIRKARWLMLANACALAAVFQFALYRWRVFSSLASARLTAAQREQWAAAAYRSWWASYDHPLGAVVFFALAAFVIYIVLLLNGISLMMAAAVFVVRVCAEIEVDWLNSDRGYGWSAVGRIFRIAYTSMALRGLALSIALLGFGLQSTLLTTAVALIWLGFVGIYILAPYVSLVAAVRRAKEAQIERLVRRHRRSSKARPGRLAEIQAVAAEIERVHNALINPMHLPRWQSSGFVVVVLFPIALTLLQIYA